jgi:hypothetical protein
VPHLARRADQLSLLSTVLPATDIDLQRIRRCVPDLHVPRDPERHPLSYTYDMRLTSHS